jgi:Protein of unknown function (DUF3224)
MSNHAAGTFDVKTIPQPADDLIPGNPIGRLFLDKQFQGGLEGTGKGQMLAAGTAVQGSAGYVALELVTGKLDGKMGSFLFQHTGSMDRGTPSLSITVVPDSGTGELVGLTGKFIIHNDKGAHSYEFDYKLEPPK